MYQGLLRTNKDKSIQTEQTQNKFCLNFFLDVKLIDGAIDSLEIDDVRLKNVKVVLIHGQCSKTAVLDPVGFVITEGEGKS